MNESCGNCSKWAQFKAGLTAAERARGTCSEDHRVKVREFYCSMWSAIEGATPESEPEPRGVSVDERAALGDCAALAEYTAFEIKVTRVGLDLSVAGATNRIGAVFAALQSIAESVK